MAPMESLPGNDLIVMGLEDLLHHRQTIPALLVAIGAPTTLFRSHPGFAILAWKSRKISLQLPSIVFTTYFLIPIPIRLTPDTTL